MKISDSSETIRLNLNQACKIANQIFSEKQLNEIVKFVQYCLQKTSEYPEIIGDEENNGISIDWLSYTGNFLSFGVSIWPNEASGHILTGKEEVNYVEFKGTPEETLPKIRKIADQYFEMKK